MHAGYEEAHHAQRDVSLLSYLSPSRDPLPEDPGERERGDRGWGGVRGPSDPYTPSPGISLLIAFAMAGGYSCSAEEQNRGQGNAQRPKGLILVTSAWIAQHADTRPGLRRDGSLAWRKSSLRLRITVSTNQLSQLLF